MDVSITKVNNRTHIRIYNGGPGAFTEQRFRLYAPNGERWDKELSGGSASLTWEFDIEDQPAKFILPYPNQASGTFSVALETRYTVSWIGSTDWEEKEKQSNLSYNIYSNSVTAPTLSMAVDRSPLSNGYNMIGVTKLTPTFMPVTKLGASVRSCSFSVEGKTYTTAPYTSAELTQGGWQTVTGTVTDTRGFTASVTQKLWVMAVMPSLSVIGNTYLDRAINYNFTPANKDAYSRLIIGRKNGDGYTDFKTVDIGQKPSNTTQTVTLNELELAEVYKEFPNTPDVPLRFKLLTYQDVYSTKIEENTEEITLKIPENEDTKPQITGVAMSGHPVILNNSSLYAKGKNGVLVTGTGVAKYNAQVARIDWKVGESLFESGEPSGIFAIYGTVPITVYVTDTRGFTNSTVQNITVSDYTKPLLSAIDGKSNIVVERVSEETKDYLYIAARRNYSSLGGNNKCLLRCRKKQYKEPWETSYIELLSRTSNTDSYDQKTTIELAKDSTYTIELSLIDDLEETDIYTIGVATEKVYMDRSGSRGSIAFGGHVTEDNAFEVYQRAFFRGGIVLDDIESQTRYNVKIQNNQLVVEEIPTTFNLRRR